MHFKLNWKRLSLWLWQPFLNLVHILCRSLSLSVALCMMMSNVGAGAFLSHVSVPLVYLPWHTTAFPLREALGGSAYSVCTLTLVGKSACQSGLDCRHERVPSADPASTPAALALTFSLGKGRPPSLSELKEEDSRGRRGGCLTLYLQSVWTAMKSRTGCSHSHINHGSSPLQYSCWLNV